MCCFMKKNILFASCFLLNLSLFAQLNEPKDVLENVKVLDSYLYKVYDVETKKDKVVFFKKERTIARSWFEYDAKGNNVLINYYQPANNQVQESFVYEYDSNNQKTLELYILQGKIQGRKTVYAYDKQGRKSLVEVYSEKGELKDRVAFEYDSIGNLIVEKSVNTVFAVYREIHYKYDERNNQIEKRNLKTFLPANEPYLEIQTFDSLNRLIGRTHYDAKDSFVWEYTAAYDAKNRLIEEQTMNHRGKVTSYAKYTYNKKDKMSSSYNFDIVQKIPPMRIEYKYDRKGLNILRYIYVQKAETPTITKRYYYDAKGNWYMWLETNHNDNMQAIASRKITYFE